MRFRFFPPLILPSLILLFGACSNPLTEIMVVVDTDLFVPDELDEILLRIDSTELGGDVQERRGDLESRAELPVTLGVVHGDGALGPLLIQAIGFKDDEEIVLREAQAHFVLDNVVMLRLDLFRRCLDVECNEGQTCSGTGCRPVDVEIDEMPPWSGDPGHLEPSDCGTEVCNGSDDDCDGEIDEGFDVNTDPENCGGCGVACDRPHAVTACIGGVCEVMGCDDGYDDCDANPLTGCESDLRDLHHCGECWAPCDLFAALGVCTTGECEIRSCEPGFDNCDERRENGCEAETPVDPFNCGRCGGLCNVDADHAGDWCIEGHCTSVCDPGWTDCDLNPDTGCEANLSDPAHCGDCDVVCHGEQFLCSGGPSMGYTCIEPPCIDPPDQCGDACVDFETNPLHCGECEEVCEYGPNSAPICEGGVCGLSCDQGFGDCDDDPSTGCETPLNTTTHCGGCGIVCNETSEDCIGGECHILSCDPGLGDCDGLVGNGCEEPLDTVEHCGDCSTSCATDGSEECIGGACLSSVECDVDEDCSDDDPCTDDRCTAGACSSTFNSAPCDDGAYCTLTDICGYGVCTGSGERCPGQLCDEATDACVGCLVDANCDDDDTCTVEFCGTEGVCQREDSCLCEVLTIAADGEGSLENCINEANAAGTHRFTIALNIATPPNQSSGDDEWWLITPVASLPSITANNVLVDGWSQTANHGDMNARGPEIEIYGSLPLAETAASVGLMIAGGSGVTVRGLAINSFQADGVVISGERTTDVAIQGCTIGTDATGELGLGNLGGGIRIDGGASEITIGGVGVGEGNIISGNGGHGIEVSSRATSVWIYGNLIGTDRTGTIALGNAGAGVHVMSGDVDVGGGGVGEGNVISGNQGDGVNIAGGTSVRVRGNTIGSGVAGTEEIPNEVCGVQVSSAAVVIGGSDDEEGNLIAHNLTRGVHVLPGGEGSSIIGNRIYDNGHSGILSEASGLLVALNVTFNNSTLMIGDEVALSTDNVAYNNTFYGSPGDGVSIEGTGIVLQNNIIVANEGYGINLFSGSMTESNNLITDSTTPPANGSGRSNTILDPSDLDVDPEFQGEASYDFALMECASPAIDAGSDLGTEQPDMNGSAPGVYNGSAPDIGALESPCP